MEPAVIPCPQAESSCRATESPEALQASASAQPARLHRLATLPHQGSRGVRALRGADLRQTRVLLHALCSMRLELSAQRAPWCALTLESRRTATMALWQNRPREIFTRPDVESGIEARLDAAFVHAHAGCAREAASELKRAYLLLCCVLTHARDEARAGRGGC